MENYKGTVTMTAQEFVELVEKINDQESQIRLLRKWYAEKSEELRKLKEEDTF